MGNNYKVITAYYEDNVLRIFYDYQRLYGYPAYRGHGDCLQIMFYEYFMVILVCMDIQHTFLNSRALFDCFIARGHGDCLQHSEPDNVSFIANTADTGTSQEGNNRYAGVMVCVEQYCAFMYHALMSIHVSQCIPDLS